jgi:hypothetical protein
MFMSELRNRIFGNCYPPQISLGIKTGIEKYYGRRVISGEAFITHDIGTIRASRLLKNTEKLYIYCTVNIFFFSIKFCSSPRLFNIFVCNTSFSYVLNFLLCVYATHRPLVSLFSASLLNLNKSPFFCILLICVSNSCTSLLNAFNLLSFAGSPTSSLLHNFVSLFYGCLSFLSFLLAVFPLLSSVSSLFPIISSFYLPFHLCLYSVSLPVLLFIIFLLSFHLVSFKSLSSPFAFYPCYIISLWLFTAYPFMFLCFSQYCMYSTISPVFFLLHPFFFLTLSMSSTRLVSVLPIHPQCIIPCLCIYVYQLSSNYSVVSHGTPPFPPPIFCII